MSKKRKTLSDCGIPVEKTGTRFAKDVSSVVDVDARTARFSISSETPVRKRGGYYEILEHTPEAIRFGMLDAAANVLLDHEINRVVGVVEESRLREDKRVEVLARFSRNSDEANTVFADVADGIRRNVSFGYNIHDGYREKADINGLPVIRVTDWEPFEVTITAVPADIVPGVGRMADRESTMSDENETTVDETTETTETRSADPTGIPDIDIQEIESDATKKERQRVNEITETAGRFKASKTVQVEARNAIARGVSWQDFNKRALELVAADVKSMPTELGMTGKEVQRYSILRMLRGQLEAKERGVSLEKVMPFEYRAHMDIMDKLPAKRADAVRGILIPYDVQQRGWSIGNQGYRAPPADTTENASLVATDHLASQFIVGLRNTSAVMMAGATTLNGLVGDVSIPREEKIPMEWLTEDEDATDVDYSTDSVTLSPTTVAGAVPITRRLLKQSSPDADMAVQNNLTLGAAEEIDKQALQGSGVGALPEGVRNQTGVLTVGPISGAITWPLAVQFETAVEVATNLHNGGAYIVHPTMKGLMKTTSKDAGSGMFIWTEGNTVNSYPAFSSAHAGATADGIVFGNFSNVLIGLWGVLDVMMDPYTKAASGGLVVRVFQDIDVAVRRGNAFAIESAT